MRRSELGRELLAMMCAIGLLAGCSASQSEKEGGAAPSTALPTLGAGIPATSVAVVWMGSPIALDDLLQIGWFGGDLDADETAALRKELDDFIMEQLGLHLLQVDTATAFLMPTGDDDLAGAVLIRTVGGSLKGEAAGEARGTKLVSLDGDAFVAVRDDTLVLGDQAGVAAALAVMAGAQPALADDSLIADMIRKEAAGGLLVVAVDLAKVPELPPQVAAFGIEGGVFVWRREGPLLVVRGEHSGLEQLAAIARTHIYGLVQVAEVNKQSAKMAGNVPEAIGAIWGAHVARHFANTVTPRVDGNRLSVEIELGFGSSGGPIVVATVGVLAAVAIPAFMKYIKKSKTTEARQHLRRLYDGARAYHLETGKLPASSALTPANPTECCEKCPPRAELWARAPWVALQFSIDDPHYYSYQFIHSGDTFTARAMGDLDCDGQLSTFEMYGTIGSDGIAGDGGIYRQDELE